MYRNRFIPISIWVIGEGGPGGHTMSYQIYFLIVLDTSATTRWANNIPILIDDKDSEYQIFISDPGSGPRFKLSHPLMSGDRIIVTPFSSGRIHYYDIVLQETQNELDDGTCTDYPDPQGHQDYADCVGAEIRARIMPVLGKIIKSKGSIIKDIIWTCMCHEDMYIMFIHKM